MTHTAALVVACVRSWTRIYTWRLPPAVRDARREEIESDLWESANDPQVAQSELIMQMVLRLTLGIADDLAWRLGQGTKIRSATRRTIVTAAATCVLLLFVALSRLAMDLPPLPEAPVGALQAHWTVRNPPPPPPPIPGAALPAGEPIFRYGRTSYSLVTEGPPPVRIKEVQPVYPPIALAAGLDGEVLVRARITERGAVTDAEVAPDGILGQSAMDAVQRWEFDAARNGTQRRALLTVRVSFERSR